METSDEIFAGDLMMLSLGKFYLYVCSGNLAAIS